MRAFLTAFPAYGRVYSTPEQMKEDFLKGKDFSASAQCGPYFSVRDFQEDQEYVKDFLGVILVQVGPYVQVIVSREDMCQPFTQPTSSI